jgi:hypothetical protein
MPDGNLQDFFQQGTGTDAGQLHAGNAITIGTSAGAKSVVFSNDIGQVHMAVNPSAGTITVNLPTSGGTFLLSGQAVQGIGVSTGGNTSGNTGTTIGTVVLVGGNNMTLSQSTAAGSLATITISGMDVVEGIGISTAGNTSGNSGTRTGTMVFDGGAGIVLSQVTGAATNTISIINSWSTGTTVSQVTSANVVGANVGRFANEGHQHAGIAAAGISNIGNTSGTSGTQFGSIVLAGGNNVTLSQSTGAGIHTITISTPNMFAGGVSTGGNTSGSTGTVSSQVVFVGSNAIILSQSTGGASNATISIINSWSTGTTVSQVTSNNVVGANVGRFANEGHQHAGIAAEGISNIGNTSGTSGTQLGTIVWAGGNNITLSQSTGAGIHTITISAGGGTISSYENLPAVSFAVTNMSGASISIAAAFTVPEAISISFIRIPIQMTTNSTTIASTAGAMNASAEQYSTFNAVVYSVATGANSRSLTSVASGSAGFTQRNSISVAANGTQYSITQAYTYQVEGSSSSTSNGYSISNTNYSFVTTNWQSLFTTIRWLDVNFANSLSVGPYWLIMGVSSSSTTNSTGVSAATNCRVAYSQNYGIQVGNIAGATLQPGIMGSTNVTSGGAWGYGSFSTAGGATTGVLPMSAISTNTNIIRAYFQMIRSA